MPRAEDVGRPECGGPQQPTWVRPANGLWHVLRNDATGPWSTAVCGRNLQVTQRHVGYVAPAAELKASAVLIEDERRRVRG